MLKLHLLYAAVYAVAGVKLFLAHRLALKQRAPVSNTTHYIILCISAQMIASAVYYGSSAVVMLVGFKVK